MSVVRLHLPNPRQQVAPGTLSTSRMLSLMLVPRFRVYPPEALGLPCLPLAIRRWLTSTHQWVSSLLVPPFAHPRERNEFI